MSGMFTPRRSASAPPASAAKMIGASSPYGITATLNATASSVKTAYGGRSTKRAVKTQASAVHASSSTNHAAAASGYGSNAKIANSASA